METVVNRRGGGNKELFGCLHFLVFWGRLHFDFFLGRLHFWFFLRSSSFLFFWGCLHFSIFFRLSSSFIFFEVVFIFYFFLRWSSLFEVIFIFNFYLRSFFLWGILHFLLVNPIPQDIFFSWLPWGGWNPTPLWKIHLGVSEPNSFLHSQSCIYKQLRYKRVFS